MKTEDVVKAVGGMQKLCLMLECHRSAVYAWQGIVPASRQYEIEVKTGGELLSDYTVSRRALSAEASNE